MDWTLIDGLLAATAAAATTWAAPLWGFEFGNELYANIGPAVYGAAVSRLHARTQALWGAAGAPPPVIMGPDCWEADGA